MSLSFDKLVQIMAKLRAPGGCPWDREQTHESILPQLIEETYETVEAIDSRNSPLLCEELGDLLLHIIFHSQIAEENRKFTINEVIDGLSEKLIRRHPHVFGDVKVKNSREVVQNWSQIKSQEKKKHEGDSLLDAVPRTFPALLEAYKLGKKAAKTGFDWLKTEDVVKKIEEETNEIKKALASKNQEELEHEIGDLFLALASLSRFLHVQPEEALRKANGRFRNRFRQMEKRASKDGKKLSDLTAAELDQLWEKTKKELEPISKPLARQSQGGWPRVGAPHRAQKF